MATGGERGGWPLPRYDFSAEIEGIGNIARQEVSDLDIDVQPTEYRVGDSKAFATIEMPDLVKTGDDTPKTVTSRLLDQTGAPTLSWKPAKAWPTKVSGANLKADGDEVAIETPEVRHEGLTIENGD